MKYLSSYYIIQLYKTEASAYSPPSVTTDRSRRPGEAIFVILVALAGILVGTGCSELQARRDIQKASSLYADGKYAEAIEVYEGALEHADLDIGHHNLAISALVAFQPGNPSPANQEYARKAAEHFQAYLKSYPKDQEIIGLLTRVWLDSEQIEQALAYWQDVHSRDENDQAALRQLGSIHRIAGNFKEAVKWDYLRVEKTEDSAEKAKLLMRIGRLQNSLLAKKNEEGTLLLFDGARLETADIGVQALQQAIAIQPEGSVNTHRLLASIYQYRSLAQPNHWAKFPDISSQNYHTFLSKQLAASAEAASKKRRETETPEGERADAGSNGNQSANKRTTSEGKE